MPERLIPVSENCFSEDLRSKDFNYNSGYIANPNNDDDSTDGTDTNNLIDSALPRNLIVFGAPGTGKSYLLNKMKEQMLRGVKGKNFERVTFYPDYSYSQFIGAYKPVSKIDEYGKEKISYAFCPGPFTRILCKALNNIVKSTDDTGEINKDKVEPFLLIVEEINRAKAASVFGDIFQILDRDDDGRSEYEVSISEDLKKYFRDEIGDFDFTTIRLPDNLYIWATMNSADQGVFPMDTAFKRRWNFKYIGVDDEELKIQDDNGIRQMVEAQTDEFELAGGNKVEWNVLRRAINMMLSDENLRVHEDKLLGPFFIKVLDGEGNSIFGNNSNLKDEKFKTLFCDKVLMYLFDDAVKTRRPQVFNVKECNRFSVVRQKFLEDGLKVFGDDFMTKYYNKQKSEKNAKILAENQKFQNPLED